MIVAERLFELVEEPGGAAGAEVRLVVEAPAPDQDDFRCAFRIIWPDRESRGYGMGVDTAQALQLGLQRAHIELLRSAEGRRGALRWLGMEDLGLPLPPGMTAETVREDL